MELTKEFKDKFVVKLKGKEFILYGGLLELSKQNGLKSISTEVLQIPSKENDMYAVVKAKVETDDGIYEEIGDATPSNVNKHIAPHILRMAATRAKARAMRDAVGIDMVALEELADDVDTKPTPKNGQANSKPQRPLSEPRDTKPSNYQLRKLKEIIKDKKIPLNTVKQFCQIKFGKEHSTDLTVDQYKMLLKWCGGYKGPSEFDMTDEEIAKAQQSLKM